MSGPFHRATASHWQQVEQVAAIGSADCEAILELRARVEALETAIKSMGQAFDLASERLTARLETPATDKPVHVATANAKPISNPSQIRSWLGVSLVDAVVEAIVDGMVESDRTAARAAIRAVADWLQQFEFIGAVQALREEANR